MHNFISKLYDKKISASGLGIFRICYALVFLGEVIQLYYFRHLIFDKIPYISPAEISVGPALIAWMIIIVFLVFGFYTRFVAIVNYLFSLTFIATISSYEYHMFYVYMAVNFLLIFINTSQVMSLDRLKLKLKYSNTRFTYQPPKTVSVLNYHILVLVAIAFVYFDSIFYKYDSHIWLNGLGMWLPASYPNLVQTDTSFLLNIKWLVLSLGYVTLLFETIFIFTFFRKFWRIPLLVIGIGLHIGILIEFPIPFFALGVIACYLLMVPVVFWKRAKKVFTFKKPKLVIFYDEECPLCNRTKIILSHLDTFNALEFKGVQTSGFENPKFAHLSKDQLLDNIYSITKGGKILSGVDTYTYAFKRLPTTLLLGWLMSIPGVYHLAKLVYNQVAKNRYVERCNENNCGYIPPAIPIEIDTIKVSQTLRIKDLKVGGITFGIIFLILLQLLITYNSPIVKKVKNKIGLENRFVDRTLMKVSGLSEKYARVYLGITHHALFMDYHFNGYNHIIAVEAEDINGKRYWLPIIDKKGYMDKYIYGPNWAKWTFRTDAPLIDNQKLKNGVRDFTSFWAVKHGKDPKKLKYFVHVKRVDTASEWEKGFLHKQVAKPWVNAGVAIWTGNTFIWNVSDIESFK